MYVGELSKIARNHSDLMSRKNNKGVSALKILQNGSSRSHYECLQNSSRLMTRLGEKHVMLGAGTTRNEQLHRELKSWGSNIRIAHIGRLTTGLSIFVLAKLLTHSSANFSPTLTQTSQSRLLSQIAGKIRVMNFFPPPSDYTAREGSVLSSNLHSQHAILSVEATTKRKHDRSKDHDMWVKRQKMKKSTRSNDNNVFKRVRAKTRTHVRP